MDQEALLRLMKRCAKQLVNYNINGPFYAAPDKRVVIFTDGHAAAEVPTQWVKGAKGMKLEVLEKPYARMTSSFYAVTADRATFQTTVPNLLEWLRSCTDACPLCGGEGHCKLPQTKTDKHYTPEEEDGESVHYGWIGSVALDRRRVDEMLRYVASGDEEIEVMAQTDYGPELTMSLGEERMPVASQGVVVSAKQWKIYVAGRNDRREAAPKFHLEGKFNNPSFTNAKVAGKKRKK